METQIFHVQRWNQGELSVDELLSDQPCRLLMRRDGTTPEAVSDLLDRVRATWRGTGDFVVRAYAQGKRPDPPGAIEAARARP